VQAVKLLNFYEQKKGLKKLYVLEKQQERDNYRIGINKFKKDFLDEDKIEVLVDNCIIFNRWKKCFCQLNKVVVDTVIFGPICPHGFDASQ
jgi:hypothetical protein